MLGVFSLTMITVGSLDIVRNLPSIALFGDSLLFFFIVSAVLFLLPSALISAELVTAWPEAGGLYAWVKHAFGKKCGFITVWLQWIANIIWYPTLLSFMTSILAYLLSPDLANNKLFIVTMILIFFWGTTAINLFGVRLATWFSGICTVCGLLFPMILIIGLAFLWILSGKPLQIDLSHQKFLPDFQNAKMWIALTAVMMSFCGMEIATFHAQEVEKPHKAFPRSLLISTFIIIFTLVFGSLAIALAIPAGKINIMVGVIQTFHKFLAYYQLQWATPIVGLILVLGCLGSLSNWIIAPTKGLSTAAKDGNLPSYFAKENRHSRPHNLLIIQAVCVTLLMSVFLLIPSISGSYWLLTALATQSYMLMYILMFSAAIYLRFKHPGQHRPFRIPGRKDIGMIVVALAGIISSTGAFCIGFIPPTDIAVGSPVRYQLILLSSIILIISTPFIIKGIHMKFTKKINIHTTELELKSLPIFED